MVGQESHIVDSKTLRRVLRKDPAVKSLLDGLADQLKVDYYILDPNNKLLYGNQSDFTLSFELTKGEINFGVIYTNGNQGKILADIILILIEKRIGKKEHW